MALDRNKTAPTWAPDAVASPQGWRHPKTGELLVSYKGLDAVVGTAKPAKKTKKVAEVVLEDDDVADEE